ncbi:hypothetical protein [Phytoactinopolyspora mesophila]|uniref:Uncharacterized protein n=1 Tax=Phytoactinopolyspora mesophila TaxID=2650750 RepID=A0A7K3M7B0_9ACTN|nr:hypothetical protein [Phytoactinopolyspora mesophila]NDL58937.1 hypothetical protein [Phytoactinopolyspora mesophila]
MSRRILVSALMLAFAGLTACTSDSDPDTERFEVNLLAGGGGETPADEPVSGSEALLPGRLTSLMPGEDGAVWAVLDDDRLTHVSAEGDITLLSPELPPGAIEIVDIAPASDQVYLLLRGAPGDQFADASVYSLTTEGEIEPAFGVPAEGAAERPATPDGERADEAPLGRVSDVAVDHEDRLVFVEQIAGAGYEVVSLVRRVEDGILHTVAGTPPEPDAPLPTRGEVHRAAFPDEHTPATSIPLLGPVLLGVSPGGEVLLQTTRSVLELGEGSELSVRLGSPSGSPRLPRLSAEGLLADSLIAPTVEFRSNLRHFVSPSMARDGGILAATFGDPPSAPDIRERYLWSVQGGTDRAQQIADAAADEAENFAGVYVSPEERVVTATLVGDGMTLLDDGTAVVAAYDHASNESIIVTFRATVSSDA